MGPSAAADGPHAPFPFASATPPTTHPPHQAMLSLTRRPAPPRAFPKPPTTPPYELAPAPAQDSDPDSTWPPTPAPSDNRSKPTFLTLPPEIHVLISQHLIYPDALSLKHTSVYFYNLVDTGVKLKIDWLVERRRLHLECPNNQRCDLGSDLRFCRGSVRLLMQRRREHIECESRPGLGCLIYGTTTCAQSRQLKTRVRRWLRMRFTIEAWGLLVALVPLVLSWLVMYNFFLS
ncbi:F-box domain-containing protein [Lasiosphaeria hispida]|uniref:F-box domain-containing protein n=1 Tax=Lasiosphaeria hispida TaxID=260671 RepID=A0AAJ0HHM9_9PEZI|nr:F-box domain-containing protein [Lasiosphaeria hispida]